MEAAEGGREAEALAEAAALAEAVEGGREEAAVAQAEAVAGARQLPETESLPR